MGGPSVGRRVASGPWAPRRTIWASPGAVPRSSASRSWSGPRPSTPDQDDPADRGHRLGGQGDGRGPLRRTGPQGQGNDHQRRGGQHHEGGRDPAAAGRKQRGVDPDRHQHQRCRGEGDRGAGERGQHFEGQRMPVGDEVQPEQRGRGAGGRRAHRGEPGQVVEGRAGACAASRTPPAPAAPSTRKPACPPRRRAGTGRAPARRRRRAASPAGSGRARGARRRRRAATRRRPRSGGSCGSCGPPL